VLAARRLPYPTTSLGRLRAWGQRDQPDALAAVVEMTTNILAGYKDRFDAKTWQRQVETEIVRRGALGSRAAEAMKMSLVSRIHHDEMRTRSAIAALEAELGTATGRRQRVGKVQLVALKRHLQTLGYRRAELDRDPESRSLRRSSWWPRLRRILTWRQA
jgi:hypothetical protein